MDKDQQNTDAYKTNQIKTLQIISGAFLSTPLILIFVATQVARDSSSTLDPMIVNVLGIVAGVNLLLSMALPSFVMKMQQTGDSKPLPGAPKNWRKAASRYTLVIILGHAIRESAVILGFVIGFMTGDLSWLYGIAAAFFVLTILSWPKESSLESYA